MTTVSPRKFSIRLGVTRAGSGDYKPIVNLSWSKKGDIYISPAELPGMSWRYGRLRPSGPREDDHLTTPLRPKLSYHVSGASHVSLSGEPNLEKRGLALSPVSSLGRAQIISVVAQRIWEMPSADKGDDSRIRDVSTVERTWPSSVNYSLSVVQRGAHLPANIEIDPDIGPLGLIRGDPTRFVIDLTGYGWPSVIIGHVHVLFQPSHLLEYGIAIASMPWEAAGPYGAEDALGLWTESMSRPTIFYERDSGVPSAKELSVRSPESTTKMSTADYRLQVLREPRIDPEE